MSFVQGFLNAVCISMDVTHASHVTSSQQYTPRRCLILTTMDGVLALLYSPVIH